MPQDTKEMQDQVNSRTANGDTPLMIAAERGHVDFVKTLPANPTININEVDVDGHTALCRAVSAGQMDAVQSLLEAPNINVTLGTPLHIALELDETRIADTLLDRKDLDINAFRDNFLAICQATTDTTWIFGHLKRIGKRKDIIPRFVRQPYYPLSSSLFFLDNSDAYMLLLTNEGLGEYPGTIKALAENFWARGQKSNRDRYLSWLWDWLVASDNKLRPHFNFYLEWLEEGWDRQMADEFNDTILHHAAKRSGSVDRLDQLLKRGFSVDLRSADGRTALQMAAKSGSIEALRLLLDSGADINAQDDDGWAALHYAAGGGRRKMVEILLGMGSDANARTTSGYSTMQIAA